MAFENGYNIYNYCSRLFFKYCNDNLIFVKSLQIVQYFENRSDFPYCIEELDNAIDKITGNTITSMAHFEAKFINYYENKMEWDPHHVLIEESELDLLKGIDSQKAKSIEESFKNDLQAFCITLKPIFDKIYLYQEDLMQLKKVTYKINPNTSKKMIRFIRNDDQYLDLTVDNNDIDLLLNMFREVSDSGNDSSL